MRVDLIKPSKGIKYDITPACAKVEWAGAALSAGRSVSIDYVNAPFDKTVFVPAIELGDVLALSDDKGEEVFYGQVFATERSSQIGTITYTAYDIMRHLVESTGQYKFKNVTPEAIAQQVCADMQIPVRFLYPTGINIASMLCDQMTIYDIIMAGYTKASKISGEKYFAMIYKRGFAVYSAVWAVEGFTLSDESNIYESDVTESMMAVRNRVKIYDDKGAQIGEINDAESAKAYGIFQEVYKQEDGVDPQTAAQKLIKVKPDQTIKISAIGDINCLSNYNVELKDKATGLSGKYWIKSDKHIWENGSHTMELELSFDKLMDTKESTKEDTKKEAGK